MQLWRICRAKYVSVAFSGVGAEKSGGRWNSKGYAVVYASENLSLAALELFVHVEPGMLPTDLVFIGATLPDSVATQVVKPSDLPADWRDYPAPPLLQDLGTDWLRSSAIVALMVPSAINPTESNILLNPAHPDIKKLKINPAQPFQFDPRMFGK